MALGKLLAADLQSSEVERWGLNESDLFFWQDFYQTEICGILRPSKHGKHLVLFPKPFLNNFLHRYNAGLPSPHSNNAYNFLLGKWHIDTRPFTWCKTNVFLRQSHNLAKSLNIPSYLIQRDWDERMGSCAISSSLTLPAQTTWFQGIPGDQRPWHPHTDELSAKSTIFRVKAVLFRR